MRRAAQGTVELQRDVAIAEQGSGRGRRAARTISVTLERAVAPCIVGDTPHAPGGDGVHHGTAVAFGGAALLAAVPTALFSRLVLAPAPAAVYVRVRTRARARLGGCVCTILGLCV